MFNKLAVERNTSVNAIAKKLGLSSGSVTAWKNGTEPSINAVIKIASHFNVSIDYLLDRTDDPTPPKKVLTAQDRLNIEIAKLTPEKRKKAESYVQFLKTEEEFSRELSDMLDTNGMRPQVE